ncbi:MAG: hypothetical protein HFJ54_06585 [Clostridia bacterium]|nr:hypothetical protein [Clostridia bacterium]
MGKSNKYGKACGGCIMAIRCQEDGKISIGSPNRMFQYVDCPEQARRICMLFCISEIDLAKLVKLANEQKDKFVFVTL